MPNHDPPHAPLPEILASEWINAPATPGLGALRGKVVVVHAFQMLCPGCVQHAIPQMARLHAAFADAGLVVLGLHSVFEHHEAMGPNALRAFLSEYRIGYPVAVDAATPGQQVPQTMARWGLRGTPSTLIVDRQGGLRLKHFGALDDLLLGAVVGRLLAEIRPA